MDKRVVPDGFEEGRLSLASRLLRVVRVWIRWVKTRFANGPNEGLDDVKPLVEISVYTVRAE